MEKMALRLVQERILLSEASLDGNEQHVEFGKREYTRFIPNT